MMCLGFLVCLALLIGLYFNVDFKKAHPADVVIFTLLWIIAMMAAGAGFVSSIP